tara:strand:- start:1653 stop:2537 length:885 start_codon:yes stop_codon:yes gene_type:complete
MGSSIISLGLGLGGGKAATASGGASGGGGVFSNALSAAFDGTDDTIDCSIATSLLASDFTTSIWVKFPQDAADADGAIFAQNYNASGKVGWRLYFNSTNGAGRGDLGVWVTSGASPQTYDEVINEVSLDLGDQTWNHLAWGRSSGTHFLYHNGSSVSVSRGYNTFDSSSSSFSDTSPAFKIFANVSSGDPVFAEGSCDEVAIWDSALTSAQITNIYKGEASGGSGGTNGTAGDLATFSPEIWWRMGDGTGDNNSSGGSPANGGAIGTIVNQGSSGSSNATGANGVTFSNSIPEG